MPEFTDVIHECWQTAEDHGFHGVNRTFGDVCALIHSEVSEAFEAFRHGGKHVAYYEVDGKPEGSLAELADVVVRVFDAVIEAGMSAEQFADLMQARMEFNKSRPYLHGKAM